MANQASADLQFSSREPRRSGRRSAHSHSNSTSTSRSLHSPPPAESRSKEGLTNGKRSDSNANGRNGKGPQQDDFGDRVEDSKKSVAASSVSSSSTALHANGRANRKAKEKHKASVEAATSSIQLTKSNGGSSRDLSVNALDDDEDQGITRCICESDEDEYAGDFMVQCETCKAWQHGLCMGYYNETDLPPGDYHCEQCRPDLHTELLLENLSKRVRHSSSKAPNGTSSRAVPEFRNSRSHSPSYASKPSRKRNTMNSRDANFDTIFKETLASTAVEAEYSAADAATTGIDLGPEDDAERGSKKRHTGAGRDASHSKRTRSTSSAPDLPAGSSKMRDYARPSRSNSSGQAKSSSRNRRGGARRSTAAAAAVIQEAGAPDVESVSPSKRSSHSSRNRSTQVRRPPASHGISRLPAHSPPEPRQNVPVGNTHPGGGPNIGEGGEGTAPPLAAHRQSHAYVVSQQPLFTSWGLPDYLAHLEEMLPSRLPKPLEVRGSGLGGEDDVERSTERGVKVKWPGKRMSMSDMNRRVRALVEWVGREQAGTGNREKRRELLEGRVTVEGEMTAREGSAESTTTKMMEALMEELIGFQERFGPGMKARERDKRANFIT